MKVALLTHYLPTERENYQELADLAIPQRDAYCARHGYQHVVQCGPYKDPSLYYAIQRLWKLLDHMLSPDAADVYWVLNVQSLLTNMGKPVTEAIGESISDPNIHFWVAHDANGLNAGSFLVRNSEWGREWIGFIAQQAILVNHCWFEQKAMQIYVEHPFFKSSIKIVPQSVFNSYVYNMYPPWNDRTPGDWRPGDLVLSLPGATLVQRLKIWREWPTPPTSLS